MPGVTKRISDHEIRDIISMWSQQIKTIQPILPCEYGKEEVIALLKEFYPHEWQSVEYKHLYYKKKDEHIKNILAERAIICLRLPNYLIEFLCFKKY